MIMPIILTLQLIKKEFSGTIRNLEDGYASVQSAIPFQSLPVNFADFFTKMFRSNDDKVVTLRKKLLFEVVCYFDFQSDTEFLSVVHECFLRLMQRESLVIPSAFRGKRQDDFLDRKIIVRINSHDIPELFFRIYRRIFRKPVPGDGQIFDAVKSPTLDFSGMADILPYLDCEQIPSSASLFQSIWHDAADSRDRIVEFHIRELHYQTSFDSMNQWRQVFSTTWLPPFRKDD